VAKKIRPSPTVSATARNVIIQGRESFITLPPRPKLSQQLRSDSRGIRGPRLDSTTTEYVPKAKESMSIAGRSASKSPAGEIGHALAGEAKLDGQTIWMTVTVT